MSFDLLRKLCATPAIPGREDAFRATVTEELAPYCDEMYVDAMGNAFFRKKGTSPTARKIMIAAHMDEISFIVRYISNDGFIYFQQLGGFDPRVLIAQRVKIYATGKNGRLSPTAVDGIIGIKATHFTTPEERSKVPLLQELCIDCGLPGDEVKQLVNIGDSITMERELIQMGNFYTGKTLDDRVGVYVMIEAFKQLSQTHDDIYAVATVQEEVGVRGAKAASFGLQPDIGIALDITIAADTPGIEERNWCVKMGAGTAIKIMDSYSISHFGLVNFLRELAEKNTITHQMEILPSGGTDAGGMQLSRSGIPVATISIPCRYTHSVVESVHKSDVEASIELTRLFMEHSYEFIT